MLSTNKLTVAGADVSQIFYEVCRLCCV